MQCFTGFYRGLASRRIVLALLFSLLSADVLASPAKLETVKPTALPGFSLQTELGAPYAVKATTPLTVLHFWATWCVPCQVELPQVNAAQEVYGKRGLRVIAITLDKPANGGQVRNFYKEHAITSLPIFYDIAMQALRSLNGNRLPISVFLDAHGKIIARANGPLDWESPEVTRFIETQLPDK